MYHPSHGCGPGADMIYSCTVESLVVPPYGDAESISQNGVLAHKPLDRATYPQAPYTPVRG
jgi:hypothetical protein